MRLLRIERILENCFLIFWAPSGHRRKKQPVLGTDQVQLLT